jgi:hypothetical protein
MRTPEYCNLKDCIQCTWFRIEGEWDSTGYRSDPYKGILSAVKHSLGVCRPRPRVAAISRNVRTERGSGSTVVDPVFGPLGLLSN